MEKCLTLFDYNRNRYSWDRILFDALFFIIGGVIMARLIEIKELKREIDVLKQKVEKKFTDRGSLPQ